MWKTMARGSKDIIAKLEESIDSMNSNHHKRDKQVLERLESMEVVLESLASNKNGDKAGDIPQVISLSSNDNDTKEDSIESRMKLFLEKEVMLRKDKFSTKSKILMGSLVLVCVQLATPWTVSCANALPIETPSILQGPWGQGLISLVLCVVFNTVLNLPCGEFAGHKRNADENGDTDKMDRTNNEPSTAVKSSAPGVTSTKKPRKEGRSKSKTKTSKKEKHEADYKLLLGLDC